MPVPQFPHPENAGQLQEQISQFQATAVSAAGKGRMTTLGGGWRGRLLWAWQDSEAQVVFALAGPS